MLDMFLLEVFVLIGLWYNFNILLNNYLLISHRVSYNILSLTNTFIILRYHSEKIMISYMLYDCGRILRNSSKYKSVYISHHLLTCHGMLYARNGYFSDGIWGFTKNLEKANILLYLDCLVKNANSHIFYRNIVFILHFITYVYYRLIKTTLYLLKNSSAFYSININLKIYATLLYIMNVLWSMRLYKKFKTILPKIKCLNFVKNAKATD